MAKEGNQLIATFYYHPIELDIYGCWDSETPENEFEFYDVYDSKTGECLNLGDPYYKFPTYQELHALVFLSKIQEYCPVCGSHDVKPDLDSPITMRNCNKCGSEWNWLNEITLNGRKL